MRWRWVASDAALGAVSRSAGGGASGGGGGAAWRSGAWELQRCRAAKASCSMDHLDGYSGVLGCGCDGEQADGGLRCRGSARLEEANDDCTNKVDRSGAEAGRVVWCGAAVVVGIRRRVGVRRARQIAIVPSSRSSSSSPGQARNAGAGEQRRKERSTKTPRGSGERAVRWTTGGGRGEEGATGVRAAVFVCVVGEQGR